MANDNITIIRQRESALTGNSVLRNTYLLLSMTLLFSAVTAWLAMLTAARPLNPFLTLIGYFALLFATTKLRNSPWGLLSIFGLTGFMGYTLGPILNLYMTQMTNGHELVLTCLAATGAIFLALSMVAVISKKDFSFMSGFLTIGIMVAFFLSLGALIFHLPAGMLAASAMFVFLSSGIILYKTSQIIHGGETNYIMATIDLYVSLYNIFLSLLTLFSGNSRD